MENSKDRIYLAVINCLFAHLMFALMGACAKHLSTGYHVAEIAFYRNIVLLIPMLVFILASGRTRHFKTKKPGLVAFRAIVGTISLIVTFEAIANLPLSYATVIFFTSSLMTPAFAHIFLKEKVGIHRWTAVLFGMTGVIVIAQPSGSISVLGLCFAISAAILHGSMYTTLRSLKTESPLTIVFYFVLAGVIIPALFLPWVAHSVSTADIPYFILIGILGGLAQTFLSYAYKFGQASLITPFSYSALLWNILMDIYIWHYTLDYFSVFLGSGLIISAQFYIIYREYLHNNRKPSK